MQVSKNGVTADLSDAAWRKSSLSGPYSDNCVEVADLTGGLRAVRDSKNPDQGALLFTPAEWEAFVGGVKLGEFG